MKKLMALLGGVGWMAALQGCVVEAGGGESISEVDVTMTSSVAVTADWGNGYCANVTITNGLSVPSNKWTVMVDLKGSSMQYVNGAKNMWNAVSNATSGIVTFTPVSYNSSIAPGSSVSFGFCSNAPNASARPAIVAYNMGSTEYASCNTQSGLNPTRAALAVAMANELGRWKPEVDLLKGGDGKVALTSAGLGRCTNGCPNTKALLGQQDDAVSGFIGQDVFNATVYREDLKASFDRQYGKIADLTRNNRGALPPDHKLSLVGGPTNMGSGNCGPHYVFKVTDLNNVPLTTAQASNLANALCFYGQGSCGANPYIAFITTSQGCPSGQTCVAIDPLDGDNGSTSTTTAGSAPTYPLNRVYNPSNSLLNTQCITTAGVLKTLKSKCSTQPSTCGTLYCM